jgi:sigma-B regulation protein RsbU (phosphoserine phosphatase)
MVSYEQSCVTLESGDLLAWFTDGVTEPESEFGEMFGEDRFIELLRKNAHRDEQQIVDLVVEAVRQWTGSEELQDDITLLLARRV